MGRRTLTGCLGFVLILGLAAGAARADKIVRIHGPTGTGYTDETTSNRGTVVRRQKFAEDGKPRSDTRYDPQTGEPTASSVYEHEPGGLTTVTHRDGDGLKEKVERFDGSGRLVRRESFDEGEPQEIEEWTFGAGGNLAQVSFKDAGNAVLRTFQYTWEDGRLVQVSAQDASGQSVGQGSYDADGNLTSLRGDVSGALRELGRSVDLASHVTQGPAGETIIVRHNADGTVDATIIFHDQRVAHAWLRHGAGCYLGKQCPFHGAPPGPPPDPSKAMRPARTGGLPADVPVPRPRPDTAPDSAY